VASGKIDHPNGPREGWGKEEFAEKLFQKKAKHEDSNIFFVLVYRRLGSVGFGMFDLG